MTWVIFGAFVSSNYAGRMGQLRVRAIDARLENGVKGFLLGMIRGARWKVTCGFCKERFRTLQHLYLTTADCPYCGTRNLLVGSAPSDRGPRRIN